MAQGTFRVYGNKTVPKLLEKINQIDIVNDLTTGGSGVPASAESAKQLNNLISAEATSRIQGDLDIKGGASTNYSSLKKIEDVIIANQVSSAAALDTKAATLQANIDAEASARTNNDAILNAGIAAEAAARTAAIASEASARTSEDATLQALITQEVQDRTAADETETMSRQNDIAAVNTTIAQEVASRIVADDNEALLRSTADTALQANIDTEILARTNADATEAAARAASDAMLDGKIVIETNERIQAVTNVTNNLLNEVLARTESDAVLDNRMSLVESGYVTGAKLKGTVERLVNLDIFDEMTQEAGWFYIVKSGTTGTRDLYMVCDGITGDYKPVTWELKSFIWLMDFNDVSNVINQEKLARIAADTSLSNNIITLDGKVDANKVLADSAMATTVTDFMNADAVLQTALDAETQNRITADTAEAAARAAGDLTLETNLQNEIAAREAAITTEANARNAADLNLQSNIDLEAVARTEGIAAEAAARVAADNSLTSSLLAEAAAREAGISTEAAARTAADAILNTAVLAEVANREAAVLAEATTRIAADTAINTKLNVIQGDVTTAGSIAKAQADAQLFTTNFLPTPKLEGQDGMLIVQGDNVGLTYAPLQGLNGIAMGEALVFLDNGDSVMVSVLNVTGNTVTLATTVAGEYNGLQVKIQYWYCLADQVGSGEGLLGQGGVGV